MKIKMSIERTVINNSLLFLIHPRCCFIPVSNLSVCLSVCLSINQSIHLSIFLAICISSIYHLSILFYLFKNKSLIRGSYSNLETRIVL